METLISHLILKDSCAVEDTYGFRCVIGRNAGGIAAGELIGFRLESHITNSEPFHLQWYAVDDPIMTNDF